MTRETIIKESAEEIMELIKFGVADQDLIELTLNVMVLKVVQISYDKFYATLDDSLNRMAGRAA